MSHLTASIRPALAAARDFAPQSRVWVYTSDRPLTAPETTYAQAQLTAFCQQWTAHNQALLATAEVFENQFVLLMVDETQAGASGCSIDKSVHFLERLGQAIGADLFERMRFGWVDAEGVLRMSPREEFADLVKTGHIGNTTWVVNSLVQTKRELEEKWLMPFEHSWHRRLV